MAKQPNYEGQIEYRKRLKARAVVPVVPTVELPQEVAVTEIPAAQPAVVIDDTPAVGEVTVTNDVVPVVVPDVVPVIEPAAEIVAQQTTPKTQLQLRAEAVELAATLTEFSDTEYTEYMEELAGTNPQLYAAVVDVIADNNAAG
jgi:hypothetical protein